MTSSSSIPILPARDLVETRNFYEQLGFETIGWWPDSFGGYAILVRGELVMHFFRYADLSPSDNYAQCYWRVDDVDGFYRDVRSSSRADSNAPQILEPEDKPWGMREFALGDPNGNLIRVGEVVSRSPRLTSLAPQFVVDDLARSMAHYKKLGFTFGEPWDGFYAIGQLDGLELHLKEGPKDDSERRHRRENEHLDAAAGVEGIEAFYAQCVENGATIIKPLTSTSWGTKDFYIEDPDGYILSFGGRPAAD